MHIVLFDIDGTLLSSGGAGKAALESAFAAVFRLSDPIAHVEYSGRTDRHIVRELFRLHGIADTPANRDRLFRAYLANLPRTLAAHRGRVLPGVRDLLDHLATRRDVAVGLLTGNIRAGARVKLGHFGIDDHFPFGGYGDDHHDRDDVAREALREVEARFASVPRDRLWVIGDTPFDVRCARTIGAKVVAVATGMHDRDELHGCQPDVLLDNLGDLDRLLGLWERL